MRDQFTSRLFSVALVVAALLTLGAIVYLSVIGREVNDYLAGLAGLTIGALLPSPLDAKVGHVQATIRQPAGEPVPVQDVADGPL
jgi:hypothetical protein